MSEDRKKGNTSVLDAKNRKGLQQLVKKMQSGPTAQGSRKKKRVVRSKVSIRKKQGQTVDGIFERVSTPVSQLADTKILCTDQQFVLDRVEELERIAEDYLKRSIDPLTPGGFADELKHCCIQARHHFGCDSYWAGMRCLVHAEDRFQKILLAEMEDDFVRGRNQTSTGKCDWDQARPDWFAEKAKGKIDAECDKYIAEKYGITVKTVRNNRFRHKTKWAK